MPTQKTRRQKEQEILGPPDDSEEDLTPIQKLVKKRGSGIMEPPRNVKEGEKFYRIKKAGSDEYTQVSEEEYLNNRARNAESKSGTLKELGPVMLNEIEQGEDIELKQPKRKKK